MKFIIDNKLTEVEIPIVSTSTYRRGEVLEGNVEMPQSRSFVTKTNTYTYTSSRKS